MKTPDDLIARLRARLDRSWQVQCAAHIGLLAEPGEFPFSFPTGAPVGRSLAEDFAAIQGQVREWTTWGTGQPVTLTWANRSVHGTTQPIPTHVGVATVTAAALVVDHSSGSPDQTSRLQRGQDRAARIHAAVPDLSGDDVAWVVRSVDGWTDTDVDLALVAASWLRTHDESGLTARQVPLEGFHAKWLESHRAVTERLTGRHLALESRPERIHFTYLDPTHLANGGRRHDSATVGDTVTPAYLPSTVIISENKDTALLFPAVDGGIAIEGDGYGPAAHASFAWLTSAPRVLYWGDIDQDGYKILNQFRAAGIPVVSMLMDSATFGRYAPFGTSTDRRGNVIEPKREALPHLTEDERQVYEQITDPDWAGPRRLEQERIPLAHAQAMTR